MLKKRNASLIIPYTDTNKTVDQLSRIKVGDKYQLNKKIFSQLNEKCGALDIDRFATNQNTLVPRFSSYFRELNSAGTVIFTQDDRLLFEQL